MSSEPMVYRAALGADCLWLMAPGRSPLVQVHLPSMRRTTVAQLQTHRSGGFSRLASPVWDMQFLLGYDDQVWVPGPGPWLQAVYPPTHDVRQWELPFSASAWDCNHEGLYATVWGTGELARVSPMGDVIRRRVGKSLTHLTVGRRHVWAMDAGSETLVQCSASTLLPQAREALPSDLVSKHLTSFEDRVALWSANEIWTFSPGHGWRQLGKVSFDGPPVVTEGRVLLAQHNLMSGSSDVIALDSQDLTEEWRLRVERGATWWGCVGQSLAIITKPPVSTLLVFRDGREVDEWVLGDFDWGSSAPVTYQPEVEIVGELPNAVRDALMGIRYTRDDVEGRWIGEMSGWQRNLSVLSVEVEGCTLTLLFRWKDHHVTYGLHIPFVVFETTAADLALELATTLAEELQTGLVPSHAPESTSAVWWLDYPYTLGAGA